MALQVLFQDEHFAAVFKPAGMMVHRNEFDRTGPAVVQAARRQFGRRVYPVHRLDRATSGVLILAFSPEACGALAKSFSERTVHKGYLTIVRGFSPDQGFIDKPIRQRETDITQTAQTQFRTLAKAVWPLPIGDFAEARFSLVAVRPLTGRRHQIRRHLRGLNHPIIGDTRWGDGRHNRYFRTHFSSRQLLLTANELALCQPFSDEQIRICAPIDSEFLRLAEIFSWDNPFSPSIPGRNCPPRVSKILSSRLRLD